ncbi:MAG: 1-(5-phosphoribosyl)-5-[(5-phosphoribosylamino)methylideneamino]imidazole-4-carboxamide isomerase [Pseudomonadota bacterium]
MNVIPAIDLRSGRCVRLFQGDFDRETEYSKSPADVATRFAALGAPWLHVVDLDGARDGAGANGDTVRKIAEGSSMRVQLGGGIRDRTNIAEWLSTGVERCVVGSAAVVDPDAVLGWIEEFGPESIVLALDVRVSESGVPLLTTHGWEETSAVTLWDCLQRYTAAGARHVLCTDVSRDGALSGPNVPLYETIIKRFPSLALQASGGVRHIADLEALRAIDCASAITGRALLDGAITPEEIRSFLPAA